VLREIVKDQSAVGEHYISIPELLRRLQIDAPLAEVRSRLGWAREAQNRGDEQTAAIELDFVDDLLRRMLAE
jgi:hypothetical protein